MLGGALEARRGRGEHTAEGARRLSGKGWRRSSRLRRLERMDLDRWMAPHQDRAIVFINTVLSQPTCPEWGVQSVCYANRSKSTRV